MNKYTTNKLDEKTKHPMAYSQFNGVQSFYPLRYTKRQEILRSQQLRRHLLPWSDKAHHGSFVYRAQITYPSIFFPHESSPQQISQY